MNKKCVQCVADFQVTRDDLDFYAKMSPTFAGKKFQIPVPDLCPDCRMQRRMIFRNESSLYHRKCSKTGQKIIAMYDENVPFPVYAPKEWFGDSWDGRDYGREFDFSRPFFEQFVELRDKVPHLSLISSNNQNCDFCNIVGECKDSYLIYGSVYCENCLYGSPFNCKKCVDSLVLRDSELCLECVDSDKLYNCVFCQNCSNSHDLKFCYAVHNCQDCFGCVNLSHKQYCIFNEQYSKEEYEKNLAKLDLKHEGMVKMVMTKLNELKLELPQRYYIGTNNEDVSGNYIFNSKNCHESYGLGECRDVKYSYQLLKLQDSQDVNNGEFGELIYDVMALFNTVSRSAFCYFIWDQIDSLYYCGMCNKNVRDCFGCVGLKHAQYCILNKQYTQGEYERMVARIIEHMRAEASAREGVGSEWGKFFPAAVSTFAYNESVASEYFPMSKDEVLKRGFHWKEMEGAENAGATDAVICEVTGKPFKIILQERAMYEKFGLPLPRRSPKQRHIDRIALRNPMKLWERKCSKCGGFVRTSYGPERKEIGRIPHATSSLSLIYCEKCYREEIY